jgi:peptidoglycan/xylan/chitin deacetylase (PgdA/CDA1 family)
MLGRLRKSATAGVKVLCYHGVVGRRVDDRLERNFHLLSDFKRHVDFFRRFEVIGIDQIFEVLKSSSSRRKPILAITFDDGYANNLLAAELLDKAGLPWSVFVSTGAIAPTGIIGSIELSLLVLHGRARHLELFGKRWALGSRAERETTFQEIRYPLKEMSSQSRTRCMEKIRQQFPVGESQMLLERFPSFRMLTWEQLRSLNAAKVIVGSHGVAHEIHHENQNFDVRKLELEQSKLELEQELTRPCNYFAYPNGSFHHLSPSEVRAAGYQLAFTMNAGIVHGDTNPFLLPRITPASSTNALKRMMTDSAWN